MLDRINAVHLRLEKLFQRMVIQPFSWCCIDLISEHKELFLRI